MPVLPLVESRMVRLWFSLPERSPSSTIWRAARSLTLPPGLKYSALPKISMPGNSRGIFSRRSRGVLPMVASKGSASARAQRGMGRALAIATYFDSDGGWLDADYHMPLEPKGLDSLLSLPDSINHPKVCQERGESATEMNGKAISRCNTLAQL